MSDGGSSRDMQPWRAVAARPVPMTDTTSLAIALGAALACGLMIGVERGWRLRNERAGSRVEGVRTYALLGGGGGLAGILAGLISPAVPAVIVLAACAGLLFGY